MDEQKSVNGSSIINNYEEKEIIPKTVEQSLNNLSVSPLINKETIAKMETEQIKCTRSANTQTSNIIIEDYYGHIRDDNGHKMKVTKYTLLNENQVFIEIIDYGATVISCWVPNSQGELEDVLLGFDSIEDHRLQNTYSIGSTLGRVTDYISQGHFKNDQGDVSELSKNLGDHHFNGGKKGFDKVVWDGHVADNRLVLTYSSRDGEEGYPGTFHARITFQLTCKNELVVDYTGMTSKPTPVNIASNLFFNLAGHNAGESEIANHTIMVNADEYVAIKTPERRPVGLIKSVRHTCLDLRVPRLLKKAFPLVPGFGYNHTFKLFKGVERKALNLATSLAHEPSGRVLDIYTDMPCVFVNTAQEFPNYGKTLIKEEVLKVTEIATPMARFGKNGNDQEESSISDEDQSVGDLELMLPENDGEGEYIIETPLTQSNVHNVQESWPIIGKSKAVYGKHSGICIRPQLFPDAVSHKNFNSVVLKPSNFYSQQTIYKFGIIVSN